MLHNSLVSVNDYANLETCAKNAIKEKQEFIRLEMKKEELLEMFKVNGSRNSSWSTGYAHTPGKGTNTTTILFTSYSTTNTRFT